MELFVMGPFWFNTSQFTMIMEIVKSLPASSKPKPRKRIEDNLKPIFCFDTQT